MDKNEILSDKEKYSEKFQHLLNNCSSGDISQYIFEKNPEFLTIDFTKLNLLEKKTKYLIALNVHKAYDSIMLYILDQFIQNDSYFTNSEKEEWQEELKDLSALNTDFSGNNIYRSQGIPQDSELAPYLLNYYMSRILEDPVVVELLQDCEITIYADNIFIANNFDNEVMCSEFVVNLNNAFNKYNFSFGRGCRIIKIGGFDFPKRKIKFDELDNYQSIKTIGMNFSTIENSSGIINIAKRYFSRFSIFITIKDLYYKIKKDRRNCLKKVYKDWFKRELRNWLKANLVTVKIFGNVVKHILVKIGIFLYLDIGTNKIKFILSGSLLDINENKCEIKNVEFISKNNLINKYFNINKKNLKFIIKNQKITRKNNLCKIFCSFRIYFYYFYCPSIKKVMTKKLGIKK